MYTHYDAVIVGGGHNGLVAAAYLARAGVRVLVLERKEHIGGAAVSTQAFPGVDARLSRYSYLLSMFPYRVIEELGLNIEARRRPTASYSPTHRDGVANALIIRSDEPGSTEQAFERFTGDSAEYRGYRAFYDKVSLVAEKVWETMLQPLPSRDALKARFTLSDERDAWDMLFEQPLGIGIEQHMQHDAVRGMVYTDASICVLSHPHDESLQQNKTFLYHVIGNKTGEWRVPVGGMGHVTRELARVAAAFGATLITDAEVMRIDSSGHGATITYAQNDQVLQVDASAVLVNAAPSVLAALMPGYPVPDQPEGTAFKINMVLKRLPQLAAPGIDPAHAFAGTFHVDEGYENLQLSYQAAMTGHLPDPMPGEIYCHTLTDPSILSPELAAQGFHTLTLYGVNAAHRLFVDDNETQRARALQRYLDGINRQLAEPIQECLALDANGQPCIEAKSTVDLENELRLPKGHIFHNDLSWVYADDGYEPGMWGVETPFANVFICGSGAMRGGCVSGIPGHNAAMKTLEFLDRAKR